MGSHPQRVPSEVACGVVLGEECRVAPTLPQALMPPHPLGCVHPEAYLPIAMSLTPQVSLAAAQSLGFGWPTGDTPAPFLWHPLPLPGAKGAGALEAFPPTPSALFFPASSRPSEAHLPVFWERPGPRQPAGGSPFLCLLLAI